VIDCLVSFPNIITFPHSQRFYSLSVSYLFQIYISSLSVYEFVEVMVYGTINDLACVFPRFI